MRSRLWVSQSPCLCVPMSPCPSVCLCVCVRTPACFCEQQCAKSSAHELCGRGRVRVPIRVHLSCARTCDECEPPGVLPALARSKSVLFSPNYRGPRTDIILSCPLERGGTPKGRPLQTSLAVEPKRKRIGGTRIREPEKNRELFQHTLFGPLEIGL